MQQRPLRVLLLGLELLNRALQDWALRVGLKEFSRLLVFRFNSLELGLELGRRLKLPPRWLSFLLSKNCAGTGVAQAIDESIFVGEASCEAINFSLVG